MIIIYVRCIVLHLFNNDTCPTGNMNCPTQVGVLQHWLFGRLYQGLYRDLSEKGLQRVSCVVFTTSFLYNYTPQDQMVNGHCLSKWRQCVKVPRDKSWDFVVLAWPNRSLMITTSSALVRYWIFFGGPSVVSSDKDLCHAQARRTWFELAAGYNVWLVTSNLHGEVLPVS